MTKIEHDPKTFHPEAMALGSWAADRECKITFISPSLQAIIRELCGEKRPEKPNWLREAWNEEDETISRPENVTVEEFLAWFLLGAEKDEQSSENEHVLARIKNLISTQESPEGTQWSKREGSLTTIFNSEQGSPNSLRFIHDLGLQLGPAERRSITQVFDLVVVRRDDGFQGQILDAWTRVQPVMENAVRAATLRLLSRSLSHNIGSHALNHLKACLHARGQRFDEWLGNAFDEFLDHDEEELVRAMGVFLKDIDDGEHGTERNFKYAEHALLYSLLRDRFEALAAVSTTSPLPWLPGTIADFVDCIPDGGAIGGGNLVWMHICRSENVNQIRLAATGLHRHQAIALPGGHTALQAFRILIENLVRDCAKYEVSGRHDGKGDTVEVYLRVEPTEYRGYVKIVMGAQRESTGVAESADREETVKQLNSTLNGPFCTPLGEPLQWGTQERLAAACLLRGLSPHELIPGIKGEGDDSAMRPARKCWSLMEPPNSPPLLSVDLGVDRRIEWTLFVPEPPRPTVVTNTPKEWATDEFEIIGLDGKDPPKIRATTELVLDVDTLTSLPDSGVLPPRLFIVGSTADAPMWAFRLREKPCSKTELLQCLVENTPELMVCDGGADAERGLKDGKSVVHNHGCSHYGKVANEYLEEEPGSQHLRRWKRKCESVSYEAHENGWSLRTWLNAARQGRQGITDFDASDAGLELRYALAQRFLVLDERIGKSGHEGLDRPVPQSGERDGITLRQKWALCGVDVPDPPATYGHEWWKEVLKELEAEESPKYRGIFVHLGILDKIRESKSSGPASGRARVLDLLKEISKAAPSSIVVVHSGRNFPKNDLYCTEEKRHVARFCHLSNLETITSEHASKVDVVGLFDSLQGGAA